MRNSNFCTRSAIPYALTLLGAFALPVSASEDSASVTIVNDVPIVTNVIANRTGDIPEPPAGKIALRLSTAYAPNKLPGTGLEFRIPDPEVDSLWAMESLEAGEEIPAGELLEGGVIFLEPGETRMVTVVYDNPSDEMVSFVALPHQDSPSYLAYFAKLTCFCLSFVYEAPKGGSWYRVIMVGTNPATPAGSKIDAVFTILTNPDEFLPAGS
jgi:hypothetical protein